MPAGIENLTFEEIVKDIDSEKMKISSLSMTRYCKLRDKANEHLIHAFPEGIFKKY